MQNWQLYRFVFWETNYKQRDFFLRSQMLDMKDLWTKNAKICFKTSTQNMAKGEVSKRSTYQSR